MYLSGVKRARKNEEVARTVHEMNQSDSIKYINDLKRAENKDKMQTALWFVTEIERYKAQMERLKKTGNKDDELRCKYCYEKLIGENINAMKAKFSEEEIKEAQDKYNKNPIWAYILDGNQK